MREAPDCAPRHDADDSFDREESVNTKALEEYDTQGLYVIKVAAWREDPMDSIQLMKWSQKPVEATRTWSKGQYKLGNATNGYGVDSHSKHDGRRRHHSQQMRR